MFLQVSVAPGSGDQTWQWEIPWQIPVEMEVLTGTSIKSSINDYKWYPLVN